MGKELNKDQQAAFNIMAGKLSRVKHATDIFIDGVLPFPCKTTSKKVIKFYHAIDKLDNPV